MKVWQKGLNRQILILITSIIMGASITMGVMALFLFHEYSESTAIRYNQEIAENTLDVIEIFFEYASGVIESIADDQEIAKGNPSEIPKELKRLFEASKVFDGMAFIDRSGKVIAYVPESPEVEEMDWSDRNYVQETINKSSTVISEPFVGFNGEKIVVMTSPVRGEDGKVIGLIAGGINPKKNSKLSSLISNQVHYDSETVVQVISGQGKTIYRSDKDLIMERTDLNIIPENIRNEMSGESELIIKGRKFLIGYAKADNLGWGVTVAYPEEKALSYFYYLRNLMISVTVVMCLLAFVMAYLQAKAITRPLHLLTEGVQRVTEGDYHFNVDIISQNEIGILTRSFNHMVGRIKEMREDILKQKEALKKANVELQIMAITDGLTKLYNHRYFQDCLGEALILAKQENKTVSLMILDIDHFKYYNDLFGHQAGDKLLGELAQLLINELGPNDMVARYGGEEFTVILYDSDNERGLIVAEQIRKAVEAFPFPGREQQPSGKVTISIGVASYPENAKNKEELVRLADEALYKAKCCSRNKVELYFSVLDELKQDLDQSEVELINSIKMLIRIINAKDKYTYGHSERVGRYAVWISEKMGLPEEEVKTIKMGAFLHDIGKIEISRSILMKRGPLVEEEFDIVRKHPFWGAGIIKAVASLNQTLPLIKYHHERFDGKGYPKGLKGPDIPLHARILAVADSFDAMTSNRPYRKRKTTNDAIEEIKRCSGSQFDPIVVEAFLNVMAEEKVG